MIVIDEDLHDHRIMEVIAAWYPGRVVSVTTLRPGSLIKDEAIPGLLCQVARPTFVTINVTDFWKKVQPHSGYCIVLIGLSTERIRQAPDFLRRLLHLPDFSTKVARMGKIVRLTAERVEYYESDRRIQSLLWPD